MYTILIYNILCRSQRLDRKMDGGGESASVRNLPLNQVVHRNAPDIKLTPYNPNVWNKDDDLVELRHKVMDPDFKQIWPQGIGLYISGKTYIINNICVV